MAGEHRDIIIAGIGLIAGVAIFYQGFVARRRYKLIELTPTSKVRSLAIGMVEVKGTAQQCGSLLTSPFARTECVYYSYQVQELRRSGKNSYWVTISSADTRDPFYLRDETGQVVIHPHRAECHLDHDHSYDTKRLFTDDNERRFKEGLERLGVPFKRIYGDKTLRAHEIFIRPGDRLYVLGEATRQPGTKESATNAENLCIGWSREWFTISEHSEKTMLSTMWWRSYLMIIGGPILTVACLAYLLHRFGVN